MCYTFVIDVNLAGDKTHIFGLCMVSKFSYIIRSDIFFFTPVQVKLTLALMHYEVKLYKQPNGTKEFPARTCRDLVTWYPGLISGKCFPTVENYFSIKCR